MNKDEKQLLLKDLCARLPYGVILSVTLKDKYDDIVNRNIELTEHNLGYITKVSHWKEYKPFLRPMSSMTEEESAELSNIISEWFDKELFYLTEEPFLEYALSKINYSISPQLFDWLNAHQFDYRGLIEKGLALEAPEGMYKY